MSNRKPLSRNHGHDMSLRASITDWAVEQAKALPKLCVTTQEKKRLDGLIKLNHLVSKASEQLEKAA